MPPAPHPHTAQPFPHFLIPVEAERRSRPTSGQAVVTHPEAVVPLQDDHPPVHGVQQPLQDQLDVPLHLHLQGAGSHGRSGCSGVRAMRISPGDPKPGRGQPLCQRSAPESNRQLQPNEQKLLARGAAPAPVPAGSCRVGRAFSSCGHRRNRPHALSRALRCCWAALAPARWLGCVTQSHPQETSGLVALAVPAEASNSPWGTAQPRARSTHQPRLCLRAPELQL